MLRCRRPPTTTSVQVGGTAGTTRTPSAVPRPTLGTLCDIGRKLRAPENPNQPRRRPVERGFLMPAAGAPLTDHLQGTGDVLEAHRRLVDAGLAQADPNGLTSLGLQTLTDLLAVATYQLGAQPDQPAAVASATCRATLAAIADAITHLTGQAVDPRHTLQLLTTAVRTARQ